MKFINTDPMFGDTGPFESDSLEALVQAMEPQFFQWAIEARDQALEDGYEVVSLEEAAARMCEYFRDGLRPILRFKNVNPAFAVSDGKNGTKEPIFEAFTFDALVDSMALEFCRLAEQAVDEDGRQDPNAYARIRQAFRDGLYEVKE